MVPKITSLKKSFSILLAEDDDDDFYKIGRACSENKINIILKRVTDGKLLLNEMEANTKKLPTLILLDLNMPQMNGREALVKLNEKYANQIPIIVLTKSNHVFDREFCLQNRAAAFYTKPLQYNGYLEIVQQLVDQFTPAPVLI